MAETTKFTYRAFLSYSHRDREWGEWVHHRLESWPVPKDLVGQPKGPGPVPAKLRPIFRDRFDLEAGHSLREQVVAALGASDALIVVCSPHSAKSTYVNEEIRQFKALGRGDRVFPIIVDGVPGDPQNDCFPDSLRRRIAPDGSLTNQIDEPIAADARDEGDGKELAILKLIAGLLGIDLDEIRKREAIDLRRRQRRTAIIAGVMGVLAIAAAASAVLAFQQRNAAIVAKHQAVEAKNDADARRKEAERRYDQALDTTLRLVTTSATFRSVFDNAPFQTSQVEAKGESDDFQEFLNTAKDPDEIWFRLVKVLITYEKRLPPELQRIRPRLEAMQMRKQWLDHAQLIVRNRESRFAQRPDFADVRADLDAELARVSSSP
jgi:hypothetical protein